jgi:integrase
MKSSLSTIEPTFAVAISSISAVAELPERTRQEWCSALRSLARCFDQPAETIPARYSAVRARMSSLHHVSAGCAEKTLANIKSNAKAALLWFRKEQGLPRDGVELTPVWKALHQQLSDPSTRYRLAPVMRYCSAVGVGPGELDDVVFGQFLAHREKTSSRASDAAARRIIARLWNACAGSIADWPKTNLSAPPPKRKGGLPFESFPDGWQRDVNRYLEHLTQVRRLPDGTRRSPCTPSTIEMRKRELVAGGNMAVRSGISLEELASLGAMLQPEVVNIIIDGYWKQNGAVPATYTINFASRILSIARQMGGLDDKAIQELGDLRFALEQYRDEGMTEKNLAVVRMALTPEVWQRIVGLPEQLLYRARALAQTAPVHAGVLAQIATAVAILTIAPIRLGNLAAIRFGENLIKPGGPDSDYWLQFRKYDVKNRRALHFRLDPVVTRIIEEYVFDFRPALLRGRNDDWLFPGRSSEHKEKISFSTQIVEGVQKASGLRITIHQYRHAAGALILKHRPGEFELVRCLLGHKSVETTQRFYLDLETTMASEVYTDIVRGNIDPNLAPGNAKAA